MALRVAETWLQACERTAMLFGQSELSEFFSVPPSYLKGRNCFICFCLSLVLGQALALFSTIKAQGKTFEM